MSYSTVWNAQIYILIVAFYVIYVILYVMFRATSFMTFHIATQNFFIFV